MRHTSTDLQSAFFYFDFALKRQTQCHIATNIQQQTAEDTETQNDIYWALHVSGMFMLRLTRLVFSNVLDPMDLTIILGVLTRDSW